MLQCIIIDIENYGELPNNVIVNVQKLSMLQCDFQWYCFFFFVFHSLVCANCSLKNLPLACFSKTSPRITEPISIKKLWRWRTQERRRRAPTGVAPGVSTSQVLSGARSCYRIGITCLLAQCLQHSSRWQKKERLLGENLFKNFI